MWALPRIKWMAPCVSEYCMKMRIEGKSGPEFSDGGWCFIQAHFTLVDLLRTSPLRPDFTEKNGFLPYFKCHPMT